MVAKQRKAKAEDKTPLKPDRPFPVKVWLIMHPLPQFRFVFRNWIFQPDSILTARSHQAESGNATTTWKLSTTTGSFFAELH
ncbi:MAG: hypothetical protein G3M70_02130 [Candidatus Nitronauta litoralis]|uniref:Uncharacterized protein n=1 Tax=Candidatus Nitronauta litoralis TaxID=2705533 RepID=A0A7T0BTK2_9BACT|nr:MAG: hypothetical protein G3M70_02130 [Candidatus Nitronauta litoralis]